MLYVWILIIVVFFILMYSAKCEYFTDQSSVNLDDNELGQKYSIEDAMKVVNQFLKSFNEPHTVIRVNKIKRIGPKMKMRLFVQNNTNNVTKAYEIVGVIPLRVNGEFRIETSKVLSANSNNMNGGDLNTGTYAELKIKNNVIIYDGAKTK